jgi:hypothetical protein
MNRLSLRTSIHINRYAGDRFPVLTGIEAWVRDFLDCRKALEHGRKPCGCKRLGGGGAFYCSTGHLLDGLR